MRQALPCCLQGYIIGKTAIRDAVMQELQCSALFAEELVDTMESRGFIQRPLRDELDGYGWRFVD
ncbi:MAG: hypothetical protein R3C68_18955 [Myxococcota bacterium]